MSALDTYPVFSQDALRELGTYVYALSDPRNEEIFYVGKGNDHRWFSHLEAAEDSSDTEPSLKLARIREIHLAGQQVGVHFLRRQIPSDSLAFELEALAIDVLTLGNKLDSEKYGSLTNKVLGHEAVGKRYMSLAEAAQTFSAEEISDVTEPVIMFNLARTWNPEMKPEELWEFTRNAWVIGARRAGAQFAFAVSFGIVRGVYRISGWRERREPDRNWQEDIGKKPRWIVECDHAPASDPEMEKYRQKSMKRYIKNPRWPFLYLNC